MNLREMYAAACAAVQSAADAIERAEAGADMGVLKNTLDVAVTEATRCKANLEMAESAAQARAHFKPIAAEAAKPSDPTLIGMDNKDVRRYSLTRAIMASAAKDWRGAELEREASEEVAKQLGRSPQGFFVPSDVQTEKRVVLDSTGGRPTIATELLAQSFIDLLRNRMMVRAAGATVLNGLVGDVAIPRQTGGATAFWVAEGGAPTVTRQTVDQVTLNPKTVGAFTDISRRLLGQSSLDVENFVRTDLATVLALAIDFAALHGTGASNQPRGIANTAGIGAVIGGVNGLAPNWAHIVNLETEVAIDNADIGTMSYMTNARVRGQLKTTSKAGTEAVMVWGENAEPLNGYRAFVTNQVRSDLTRGTGTNLSAIFFGNWADLIIGQWGTLDILVDPYTGGTSGTVRVIALQDVDVAVRQPMSFAAMLDAITV